LDNMPLPKLKKSESAVSLLRNVESVSPLYKAMTSVLLSYGADTSKFLQNAEQFADDTYTDLDSLRAAVQKPLLARALAMQSIFPNEYQALVTGFRDIFPSVTDVRVGYVSEFSPHIHSVMRGMVTVGIKETGVPNWVFGPELSSGMFRTFVHLLEFELSPRGTIFLIDEVEDSLGINCLSAVIDLVKEKSRDLQFIMTSHHPYIINNIGIEDWRIVTRKGSTVTVRNAGEISALNGQSRQDKFIRLINAPEYEAGIQ
jgi:hypothetical protein